MPVCVKCSEVFPPNYVEILENSSPDVNGDYPKICIFCKLLVSSVERETSNGSGKYVEYTKKQCIEDYKKFLSDLKKSKNVRSILEKTGNVRSIR